MTIFTTIGRDPCAYPAALEMISCRRPKAGSAAMIVPNQLLAVAMTIAPASVTSRTQQNSAIERDTTSFIR